MPVGTPAIVRFSVYEVDLRAGELRKHGLRVKLQDQPLRILLMLLERPGEVVTREELREKLWPGDVIVDFDHGLNRAINRLREALSDSADTPRFVETLPRRGYRFIAAVETTGGEPAAVASAAAAASGGNGAADALPLPAATTFSGQSASDRHARRRDRGWGLVALAILFGVLATAAWFSVSRRTPGSARAAMTTLPLTSFHGLELQPAFSPDSRQVAFVWDGEGDGTDIYVKLLGESAPLRLTRDQASDHSPTWSPDGREIAFVREKPGGHTILAVPALGGPERKLGESAADGSRFGMDWSPDGKTLAVVDRAAPKEPNSIFLLALESGAKKQLTQTGPAARGDSFPAFSPDGKKVAFTRLGPRASDVYIVPVEGGAPVALTAAERNLGGLSWSADGRSIIYSTRRAGGSTLWRVPAAPGAEPERLPVGGENSIYPSLAPAGARLAYTELVVNTNIWRLDAAGSVPATKLIFSTRREDSPHYSPDGTRIVFGSDRSGFTEIWVADSEGRNPVRLTSFAGPLTGTPRWSPDGKWIAFDARPEGRADIFVISADGGPPRAITTGPHDNAVPSWSRDGKWIYFASNRSGDTQIWKTPLGGGDAVQVTRKGGFEAFESPNGKFVYYSRASANSGLWRVPAGGGDEAAIPELAQAGYRRYWAVTSQGIYFASVDGSSRPSVKLYSFATRRVSTIATAEKTPLGGPPGLAVSPDGRWILYTQVDRRDSDIMLVENFQ